MLVLLLVVNAAKKTQMELKRTHHLSTVPYGIALVEGTCNMLEKFEDPVKTNKEKWHQ
jgi:hypothetical protein